MRFPCRPVVACSWRVLLAGALAGACSVAPPEWQVVYDAAQALGGTQLVRSLAAIEARGEGTYREPGGAADLSAAGKGAAFRYTVAFCCGNTIPFRAGSQMRVQQGRHEVIVDGEAAYDMSAAGDPQPLTGPAMRARRLELLHHPVTVLRAALEHGARVTNLRLEGGEQQVDITSRDGDTVTMAVDPVTRAPARVLSIVDHPTLGRLTLETAFADYELVRDQLRMPRRLTRKLGAETVADIRITTNIVDGNAGSGMQSGAIARVVIARPAGKGGRGGS